MASENYLFRIHNKGWITPWIDSHICSRDRKPSILTWDTFTVNGAHRHINSDICANTLQTTHYEVNRPKAMTMKRKHYSIREKMIRPWNLKSQKSKGMVCWWKETKLYSFLECKLKQDQESGGKHTLIQMTPVKVWWRAYIWSSIKNTIKLHNY